MLNDPLAISYYLGHYPSGASLNSVDHFIQIYLTSEFKRFDYGLEKNIEKYGQPTPPLLDLSTIKDIPIGMFVGAHDLLATSKDAKEDYEKMKSTVVFYNEYDLGHVSFFVADDMSYFVDV